MNDENKVPWWLKYGCRNPEDFPQIPEKDWEEAKEIDYWLRVEYREAGER